MAKKRIIPLDRTTATILLAIILIVIMGNLRPKEDIGIYPKQYWASKIHWKQCADAVITGDSRTLMGVSPEELQKKLNYRCIRNYGFGANWYSREYLEAIESLMLPQADRKAVIVGFSPHSLTCRSDDSMGNFIELRQMSKQDAFLDIHFGALVHFFEPMSFRDAAHGLFPAIAPTQTVKEYKQDGWVAVHKEPTVLDEVKRYRGLFEQRQVSQEVIHNITDFVSKWTAQGIRVYGFLVPTCREMVDVEEQLSGFQKESFIESFRVCGGEWIDVDLYGYKTFDGSHLQDEAARKFSADLAAMIAQIDRQPKQHPSALTATTDEKNLIQ